MPYVSRKVRGKNCYRVTKKYADKKNKRRVFSKCTSLKNAKKQLRLLRAIQYDKKFKPNSRKNRRKTQSL
jgi:hypothetical protein